MLAVIKTAGKQFRVSEGNTIKVDKLVGTPGEGIVFDEVFLIGDEKNITLGAPAIAGATVTADVIAQGKSEKVSGVKHKAKKRYKMTYGHRQYFTEVKITGILSK